MSNTCTKLRKSDSRYEIHDLHLGEYVLSVTYLQPFQTTLGHQHEFIEGYYFSNGIGRIQLGDETKTVEKKEFFIIPPNTFHRVFNDCPHEMEFVCVFPEGKLQ